MKAGFAFLVVLLGLVQALEEERKQPTDAQFALKTVHLQP
jgi:hypothetical protein